MPDFHESFHLVCDACLKANPRPEKTCTHGAQMLSGAQREHTCVECGAKGLTMHCLGSKTNGVAAPAKTGLEIRKCSQLNCNNAAEVVVVLLLRPAGYRGRPMRMRCGLVVCTACRSPIPDKFIDNESWSRLLAHFDAKGQKRPHRILTDVEYVPIGEDADLDGYV